MFDKNFGDSAGDYFKKNTFCIVLSSVIVCIDFLVLLFGVSSLRMKIIWAFVQLEAKIPGVGFRLTVQQAF
jgi:uncharacterized membrane protein